MNILYDLLDIEHIATCVEIEQGYRHSLDVHTGRQQGFALSDYEKMRLHAIREAYLVLSSPLQRQVYDKKIALRPAQRKVGLITEKIFLASALLIAAVIFFYYTIW